MISGHAPRSGLARSSSGQRLRERGGRGTPGAVRCRGAEHAGSCGSPPFVHVDPRVTRSLAAHVTPAPRLPIGPAARAGGGGAGSGGGARLFPWLRPRGRARRGRAGPFLPREPRERLWARSGTSGHPAGRHGPQRSSGLPRRGAGAPLEEALEAPGPWPALRLLRAGGRPGRRGHEQGGEAPAGVSAGTAGGWEERAARRAPPCWARGVRCPRRWAGLGGCGRRASGRRPLSLPVPPTLRDTRGTGAQPCWSCGCRTPAVLWARSPGSWGPAAPSPLWDQPGVLGELVTRQCLGARLGSFSQEFHGARGESNPG